VVVQSYTPSFKHLPHQARGLHQLVSQALTTLWSLAVRVAADQMELVVLAALEDIELELHYPLRPEQPTQ
jgi:hypothetical protein